MASVLDGTHGSTPGQQTALLPPALCPESPRRQTDTKYTIGRGPHPCALHRECTVAPSINAGTQKAIDIRKDSPRPRKRRECMEDGYKDQTVREGIGRIIKHLQGVRMRERSILVCTQWNTVQGLTSLVHCPHHHRTSSSSTSAQHAPSWWPRCWNGSAAGNPYIVKPAGRGAVKSISSSSSAQLKEPPDAKDEHGDPELMCGCGEGMIVAQGTL